MYLHTGRGAEVLQVLAGAVNAEILILLKTGIPLLSLSLRSLSSVSSPHSLGVLSLNPFGFA